MFWANIGLIGGSTKFPGFKERLQVENSLTTIFNADGRQNARDTQLSSERELPANI